MTTHINRRAAHAVVLHARDRSEARELLAMLGLVVDGRLAPDDVRRYDVPEIERTAS